MEIEVYGDSIRAGYNLNDQVYCEKVSENTINYSFNGASIFDILPIVYQESKEGKAIAIIGCGINDLIMGRSVKAIGDRIFKAVDKLIKLGKTVIVESILPVKKYYFLSLHDFTEEEINNNINDLNILLKEKSQKIGFTFLEYKFEEGLSTRDGLHPDEKANEELYRQLKEFLCCNGFLNER